MIGVLVVFVTVLTPFVSLTHYRCDDSLLKFPESCRLVKALNWCNASRISVDFMMTLRREGDELRWNQSIVETNHSAYQNGCVWRKPSKNPYFVPRDFGWKGPLLGFHDDFVALTGPEFDHHYGSAIIWRRLGQFGRFIRWDWQREDRGSVLEGLLLFLVGPLLLCLFWALSAIQLLIFHRQGTRKGGKIYIHQFCLALTDLISVSLFAFFLYFHSFNIEFAIGCWFARFVPWRILSQNLTLLSSIQLLGITLDRIDGMARPTVYFKADHRRRAWLIISLAVSAPIALSYSMLLEQNVHIINVNNPIMSAELVRPRRYLPLPAKLYQLNAMYYDPLRAQQIEFCHRIHDIFQRDSHYKPHRYHLYRSDRTHFLTLHRLLRCQWRYCFYFNNKPNRRNTLINVMLSGAFTFLLCMAGFAMAVLHRRTKIKSANLQSSSNNSNNNKKQQQKSKNKSREAGTTNASYSNLIFYSVTIQTLVQALFSLSMAFMFLKQADIDLEFLCGLNNGFSDWLCRPEFRQLLAVTFGFLSYFQNFFIFVCLSKVFRDEVKALFFGP